MKKQNAFFQHWIWFVVFALVLLPGLHIRFYPQRAHVWSDTNQQATVFVLAKLRGILAEQINAQFPNIPQAQRNAMIEERFAQTLHNDSAMVRKTIAQAAENLRGQSSDGKEKDRVYLQEADGYYYYQLTQNIISTGNIGREFKGSKYFNEKMAAPFGFWQPITLHPHVGLLVSKIMGIFKPDAGLVQTLSYTGPILSAITLAAFLLLCFIMRLSPLASGIGAFYFYMAPIFVKRSTFAWYDDDAYNLLFPLLILCVVFHALRAIKNQRDSLIYGAGLSLLFMIYALFWFGWGYTFAIVLISGVAILIAHYVLDLQFKPYAAQDRKGAKSVINKDLAVFFLTILGATIAAVSLMFGPAGFFGIFLEGASELKKFTSNQLSLWPNLFVAVGELKRSSIKGIMTMTGNAFSFCGAFLTIPLWGYMAYNRRDRAAVYQLITLTLLLLVDIKITLGAERFILLCLVPLAILFAMGLSCLVELLRGMIHPIGSVPAKPNTLEIGAGVLLAAAAVFFPMRSIQARVPELLSPIFNATWEAALVDIKEKTPPDAIVTTWWPPGHFIKAISDRRVTFDGATLSQSKEAYWVANLLLTSDERKAAGILRMLNTGGTRSLDLLESLGIKTSDAVSLLHQILPLNPQEAEDFLSRALPPSAIEELLALTHKPAPASYVLVYSELMEKNIGLQFVGKWNFKQIEDLNKNPQALKKLPPANSPDFFEFLWQTIGGPYKYSEALIAIGQDGSRVDFDQGLSVDLGTMSVSVKSPKFGAGTPLSIVYSDGNKTVEKIFPSHNLNYSVVLFKENTRYYCRLMDRELANSLLVKFMIFKGQGLELFRPLSLQSDMTGREEVQVFELIRTKFK